MSLLNRESQKRLLGYGCVLLLLGCLRVEGGTSDTLDRLFSSLASDVKPNLGKESRAAQGGAEGWRQSVVIDRPYVSARTRVQTILERNGYLRQQEIDTSQGKRLSVVEKWTNSDSRTSILIMLMRLAPDQTSFSWGYEPETAEEAGRNEQER